MLRIREYIAAHKNIYIYGAGYYGRVCYVFLAEHGIEVAGFMQSTPSYVADVLGLEVYEGAKLGNVDDCGIVVAVGEKYRTEISAELTRQQKTFYMLSDEDLTEMENRCQFNSDFPIKNHVNVLLYHRVNELKSKTRTLNVTPLHFEEQMRFLKENYKILRFEDDWSDIREKSIVVTFDDGYADFYQYALPIIDKLNIPVTLFVSTRYIDTTNPIWTDALEEMLFKTKENNKSFDGIFMSLGSDEERVSSFYQIRTYLKNILPNEREDKLKELAGVLSVKITQSEANRFLSRKELENVSKSPNITIGSHTVTHNMLSAEPLKMQKFELEESKRFLESVVGYKVNTLSYPYGELEDFTDETVSVAKTIGYAKIAAAFGGMAGYDDKFGYIPRNSILDWKLELFQNKIRKMYYLHG